MCHDLQDMISLHRPTMFQNRIPIVRIVNLLTIRQDQTFSRGNTPNNRHIMFFTTTLCPSLSVGNGFWIRKSKPPIKQNRDVLNIQAQSTKKSNSEDGEAKRKCLLNSQAC